MNKKIAFLNFVNQLMEASPQIVAEMSEEAKIYWTALQQTNDGQQQQAFTENGKLILKFLQESTLHMHKSKDIAEEIGISSRSVSGAIRRLVTDGYVEKLGSDPVIYSITEKGRNVNLKEYENEET